MLLSALGVIGVVSVGVAGLQANPLASVVDRVTNGTVPRLNALAAMSAAARQIRTREYRFAITTKSEKREKLMKDMAENIGDLNSAFDSYEKVATAAKEKADLAKLKTLWVDYEKYHSSLGSAYDAGGQDAVTKILEKDSRGTFVDNFMPLLEQMGKDDEKQAEGLRKDALKGAALAGEILWGTTIFSTLLLSWIGFLVYRSIVRPIERLQSVLKQIEDGPIAALQSSVEELEKGNLAPQAACDPVELHVQGNDELAKLGHGFNAMSSRMTQTLDGHRSAVNALSSLVTEVRNVANDVQTASQELARATEESGRTAQNVAAGTEEFARATTAAAETAARVGRRSGKLQTTVLDQSRAIEGATVEATSAKESAIELSEAAETMSQAAGSGRKQVHGALAATQEAAKHASESAHQVLALDEKGKEIGKIVEAIEQIAEQTNLLALNAAIEAARAGEHGRGFAVVADEVRKLAEQSGRSAQEINSLVTEIRDSLGSTVSVIRAAAERTNDAAARSNEASESLETIVSSAAGVVTRLEIVRKSAVKAEQSLKDVMEMAGEATKRTENMSQDAMELSDIVTGVSAAGQQASSGAQEMGSVTEEVAASAHELARVGDHLGQLVGRFQLDDEEKDPKRFLKVA